MTEPRSACFDSIRCLLVLTLLSGLAGCDNGSTASGGSVAATADLVTETTTTGQGLSLDAAVTPDPETNFILFGQEVSASAVAMLGEVSPEPVNFVYLVDVSGSMGVSSGRFDLNRDGVLDSGDDCNNDGDLGGRLDAACFALLALNERLGSAANVEIGVVIMGATSAAADVDPADGEQSLTSPPNADRPATGDTAGNGIADIEEVIRSVGIAGIGEFTAVSVTNGSGYRLALRAVRELLEANDPDGEETTVVVFISDGRPTDGRAYDSELGFFRARDAAIQTFSVFGECRELQRISQRTGGRCTQVFDVATLPDVLPEQLTTNIASLELTVNGISVATAMGPEPMLLAIDDTPIGGMLVEGPNTVAALTSTEDGANLVDEVQFDVVTTIPLRIDIRPGDADNRITVYSEEYLPVAVYGESRLDVTQIDLQSLRLAGAPIAFEDDEKTQRVQVTDVDGDGFLDLLAEFCEDRMTLSRGMIEAELSGQRLDGGPLSGSDSVAVVFH